MHLYLLTSPHK